MSEVQAIYGPVVFVARFREFLTNQNKEGEGFGGALFRIGKRPPASSIKKRRETPALAFLITKKRTPHKRRVS